MHVTVALEVRYTVTPDGSVWSQGGMARSFWERYLEVFDAVRIVARARLAKRVPDDWHQVDSPNVLFQGIPDYQGPWQFLKRYPKVRAAIDSAASARGAVILRVGSQISNIMEHSLKARKHPYALEVIGDPWAVFAPGVVDHPLRPFFRWHLTRQLRRQCLRAISVSYVTKRSLQERYPTRSMSVSISDVELPPEAILSGETPIGSTSDRATRPQRGSYRIVTVAPLEQMYKGTDVLIEALARCVHSGLDLTAVIVGDGQYRHDLMAQADRLGMSPRIEFTGQVTAGEPVRRILDTADLFVLPSRTEGLPRALIEAMARGVPCIGSAVGGIPELLDPPELVPADDSAALADLIQAVLKDSSRMASLSTRNISVAREFGSSILAERRRTFHRYVRDCTQAWESQRTA